MSSAQLENLVGIDQLKKEPPRAAELSGLKRSGLSRLADAERVELAFESRFDLAYNAGSESRSTGLLGLGEARTEFFGEVAHGAGQRQGGRLAEAADRRLGHAPGDFLDVGERVR